MGCSNLVGCISLPSCFQVQIPFKKASAVLATPLAVHVRAGAIAVCNPIVARELLSQWFCLAMCISMFCCLHFPCQIPLRSMPRRRLVKRKKCQQKKCQKGEVSRARAVKTKRWKEKEMYGSKRCQENEAARDVKRMRWKRCQATLQSSQMVQSSSGLLPPLTEIFCLENISSPNAYRNYLLPTTGSNTTCKKPKEHNNEGQCRALKLGSDDVSSSMLWRKSPTTDEEIGVRHPQSKNVFACCICCTLELSSWLWDKESPWRRRQCLSLHESQDLGSITGRGKEKLEEFLSHFEPLQQYRGVPAS